MNLDMMRAEAYGHFLRACTNEFYRKLVFTHFAVEELEWPEEKIPGFVRDVVIENEDEIETGEFDRFYTWYYINYVINTPVKGIACNPGWVRISRN
jgi:hypothetical protein